MLRELSPVSVKKNIDAKYLFAIFIKVVQILGL